MRRLGGAALLVLALAACATPGAPKRTAADVDKDQKTVAGAIESADRDGASFHLEETLVLSGQGQSATLKGQADGVVRDGRIRMQYRFLRSQNQSVTFDMVVTGTQIFTRPHGGGQWRWTPAAAAAALMPAVRLTLLRESVLLARNVGAGSITIVNNGFARRYRVAPDSDQIEQLMAIAPVGSAEAVFLKTARAELDAYLTLTGDKLTRLEAHLQGTDPADGTTQKVDCSADYRPAKVDPIQLPADAVQVQPNQILGT